MNHDDDLRDLRDLLQDAVGQVHPEPGLERIRARTRRSRRRPSPRPSARPGPRAWLPVAVAAAVATVLVIGGSAWLANRGDPDPAASVRTGTTTSTGTTGEAEPRESVPVYYVGNTTQGLRLFREDHDVRSTARLQEAVQQAVARRPADHDYSAWALTPVGARAAQGPTAITVDVTGLPADARPGLTPEASEAYLQAVVWTADAASRTDLPVRFLVDGQRVDRLFGADTSAPVARVGADSVLAPVSITSPTEGATVPRTFRVTGTASTFEGNVIYELEREGRRTQTGYTTARECCTTSPYSFEVTVPPGRYTLVVHDTDESDGEGVGVSRDTREITVR